MTRTGRMTRTGARPGQLALLLGRALRLPADEDGSYDLERVELIPVVVDLSPRQAEWMGVEPPEHEGCPGCLLFGCCARHDGEGRG
jgi:hypothetical protein